MVLQEQEIAFVREVLPFWKDLTETQRSELIDHMRPRSFARGDHLHAGEADCSGVFLLRSGQVRTFIISDSGREITLFRLFERDICIFSASCMMPNINFDVYIDAEKDTETLLIPTCAYKALSAQSPAVKEYTAQLIASRFSDVMWMLEQALFQSFDKRLAAFLLEQRNIEDSLTLRLTHEEIAKHLGSAREVVTRMLKVFQDQGMVKLSRGGIEIIEPRQLEQLAE
ncbi:Crp/Fnr family transcriptional regulator [Zongyangia hominis]|uniref:Crp/Fnr family transcriptional regulator n=1 Tax=Zongyangia hominis TaxID=2763677 RepID=A0A926EAJ7_9FIRM|nr:Crp/Fnr family transcriptional regulator [Zongyangia hominis]MBC8570965.1 Crp/Fnr family transcriptional regulator [Zongyangia hominis]